MLMNIGGDVSIASSDFFVWAAAIQYPAMFLTFSELPFIKISIWLAIPVDFLFLPITVKSESRSVT
jgi:hypothetical protein